MNADLYPFDRWFSFEDRWPASVVNAILDQFQVTNEDTVYDPFVGCGTTAVAAAIRGCTIFCCDLNPIAILITHYKLSPPLLSQLDPIVTMIEEAGLQQILRSISQEPEQSQNQTSLLRFVLAVAILRTGWHLGKAWREAQITSKLRLLYTEIREDTESELSRTGSHRAKCSDFRDVDLELTTEESGQVVLIASPPFFGSDTNPRVVQLAKLLGLQWPLPLKDEAGVPVPENAACFLRGYHVPPNCLPAVAKHLIFLSQVANHAARLNCGKVAIEMSGAVVDGQWLAFDEFLASCLKEHDYSVNLQVPSAGRQEAERLIFGYRT